MKLILQNPTREILNYLIEKADTIVIENAPPPVKVERADVNALYKKAEDDLINDLL